MSDIKTVLITGATSGIGLETSKLLFDMGYGVVLLGRDEKKTKNLSEELNDSPYYIVDLENTDRINEVFSFLNNKRIKLDGMVHAAGNVINVPVRSCQIEQMKKQMNVHYYAFLELCKGFQSKKVSNDEASIVAVSSLASVTKLKGSVLYAGSKSALNSAISVASKEFVKRHIRVNGIMPAYVETRMTKGLEELIDINEKQPWGMISPCDIAVIIEFLLSDKCKKITGALIPVSAGMEF